MNILSFLATILTIVFVKNNTVVNLNITAENSVVHSVAFKSNFTNFENFTNAGQKSL